MTITNGCDFDDFDGIAYQPGKRFRITHTGSFFGRRDPRPFLTALADSGLDVQSRASSATSGRPTASGPKGSASATGSSSSTTSRAAVRSSSSATRRRCCS